MLVSESAKSQYKKVEFNLTGFEAFQGVAENPTELIMKEFIKRKTERKVENISEVKIVGVAIDPSKKALEELYPIVEEKQKIFPDIKQVVIHFGVNSQAKEYNLELHGYNQADFRCPDNQGNIARNQKIDTKLPREHYYRTLLPIELAFLRLKDAFPVKLSMDPGRFLCNYIYYHSLKRSYENNIPCLFVHIPHHTTIPLEDQLKFIDTFLAFLNDFYLETLINQYPEEAKKKITFLLEKYPKASESDICEFVDRTTGIDGLDELSTLFKQLFC